jgi:endonuclease YncB( thermonuclease family)
MKILLFLLLFISFHISAQTLTGRIVHITDGDTVVLLDDTNTQHKIRLHGIDSPEKGQPYGNMAREYISGLIANKTVVVEYKGMDRYKRVLGVIYLGEMNINAQMIRAGYAWNYKYSKDKYYIKLQEKAKAGKKGLWVDKNAIDPWEYRKLSHK